MRDLNYALKQLCHRNRDGSYATQRDREHVLDQIANQLQELGYRHMRVERWKAEGLTVGTIKNRMAELRWWAEKIGKQKVVARDNEHYGIGRRQYVTNVSKACELTVGDLSKITDAYTRMSLQLQAAFGLRRGESIKIRPEWADRGDTLVLKDTWTKGGRGRCPSATRSSAGCSTRPSASPAGAASFRPTRTTSSSCGASSISVPRPAFTVYTDTATSTRKPAIGS